MPRGGGGGEGGPQVLACDPPASSRLQFLALSMSAYANKAVALQ
jgi:hypothetical protein